MRLAGRCPSVVQVCPEVLGGLATPREPAERVGDRVVTRDGGDVSAAYRDGAARSIDIAREVGARLAILKSKSPACGVGAVYDGTFSGTLTHGDGVTAQVLKQEGIGMVDEQLVEWCEPSVEHPVAIVLGSGLGALADRVKVVRRIPYTDIDDFPEAAIPVAGHRFQALVGKLDEVPVVVYPGRIHLYQGYDALEVTSLVRHAAKLGCRSIILSCASGAVGDTDPGAVGLITDQINLTGKNPLTHAQAVADAGLDTPFVPMAGAYSPYLGELARQAAEDAGTVLAEGTYAGLLGPTYETAAEIRMLGTVGADFVGMSTVCEAIMARAMGMQVLGLTLVTNKAGQSDNNHAEVLERAEAAAKTTQDIALGVLHRLGA